MTKENAAKNCKDLVFKLWDVWSIKDLFALIFLYIQIVLQSVRGNIHGHIHLKGDIEGYGPYEPKPLEGRYYNVCCELHDYTPIKFEEIVKYFESL